MRFPAAPGRRCFCFVRDFEGTIPGSARQECGNYLAHDLEGAKKLAEEMLPVLENWTEAQLQYPKEVLA